MSIAASRITANRPVSVAGSVLTAATIKCCLCGMDITGLHSMCLSCLAKETDITANLTKQEQLTQCRECGKWKGVQSRWLRCDPESPELLALCLKKIKNLGNPKGARLVDAKFVWTEEHSRRIIVRLTVESMEVASRRDMIRQTFDCEFVVNTQMCGECQSDTVDQTWRSVVQLRQNLSHRRTMYFLEQEILRLKLAEKASNVEESPSGLDVYFNKHEHAVKFADACQVLVPIGNRTESKKLTGQDLQNNEFKFRHTICLELVPLCKYDIAILPKQLRSSLFGGSRNGLVLVENVARNLHIRELETGRTAELQPAKFFSHPFRALGSAKDATEFMVLDVEDLDEDGVTLEVARMKDFGQNDDHIFVNAWSRFAISKLESGDILLGYDLSNISIDDVQDPSSLPAAVLFKKQEEGEKKKRHSRKNKGKKSGQNQASPSANEHIDDNELGGDEHVEYEVEE